MDHSEEGPGAIAIHRWFAQGAGWSYHPWFQSRMYEFLKAITPELDGRGEILAKNAGIHVIDCQALGGFLIGEQVPDPDCPDPLAAERCPTILRVAFLREMPEDGKVEAIRAELRQFPLPQKTGPDAGLKLAEVPTTPLAKLSRSGKPNWRLVTGLIAALLLFCAGVFLRQQQLNPPRLPIDDFDQWFPDRDHELQEAKAKMPERLGNWDPQGREDEPETRKTPSTWRNVFLKSCLMRETKPD
jgi:hypothetical protein